MNENSEDFFTFTKEYKSNYQILIFKKKLAKGVN